MSRLPTPFSFPMRTKGMHLRADEDGCSVRRFTVVRLSTKKKLLSKDFWEKFTRLNQSTDHSEASSGSVFAAKLDWVTCVSLCSA